MSALKVNQIRDKLRRLYEANLNLTDIGKNDVDRENKVLSRCLAAFAVQNSCGCTEKEASLSIWDGSDDNGVDAAYYDSVESRVVLVQSKWLNKGTGEPESRDIGAFAKGVNDLIEGDEDSFSVRLKPSVRDIVAHLLEPGTKVHVVIVSTGFSGLARHATDIIEKLIDNLNGDVGDKIASYEIYGLNEVYSGLTNDPMSGSVSIDATLSNWSPVSEPYPAYFGIIDGLQLKAWWIKHGKKIVSANIRQSLGTTEVNSQIRSTAATNPENFWYFNNGITLTAQEAVKAPGGSAARAAGNFALVGASVVNGAQTISSLSKVESDDALSNVKVPIRIIILGTAPEGFGTEVTRTNNFQNRVEPRDFVAQDPQQRRLRQEMNMEGVEYQFVRSDVIDSSESSCELIEVTNALGCASGDAGLAVQLKTGISRFFVDLSKAPYKSIYNPSVSGAYAFNATLVLREIEAWISKKKQHQQKKGAAWGTLVHGNRILATAVFHKLGKSILNQTIVDCRTQIKSAQIASHAEEAYTKMLGEVQANFHGKFLAVLFKNPTASKKIFDAAVK